MNNAPGNRSHVPRFSVIRVATGPILVGVVNIDVVNGQPSGRRTHFLRVEKGRILLGVELLPTRVETQHFGLIACGLPNTKLRRLDKAMAKKHADVLRVKDGLHGLIEEWDPSRS